MDLTREQNEELERVINHKFDAGVCHMCGTISPHNLRWCNRCGNEFCKHKHTLLEMILIAQKVVFESGKYAYFRDPYIVSRMQYFLIKDKSILPNDFQKYIENAVEVLDY